MLHTFFREALAACEEAKTTKLIVAARHRSPHPGATCLVTAGRVEEPGAIRTIERQPGNQEAGNKENSCPAHVRSGQEESQR